MAIQRLNPKGVSFIELALAVLILGTLTSAVMVARNFMAKHTVRNSDKAYATQKAIQMYEELRALVSGNEKTGIAVLDDYDNGSKFDNVLTTDRSVDVAPPSVSKPDDPLSGNRLTNGNWRYLRQILVKKVANDPYVRQVTVKVYRYASDQNPGQPGELLSTVGGMMRTITGLFPPTQVMDVYVLSVNNIQAWWAVLPALSDTMRGVLEDIQSRNPGLELRTHYITRSSFGRDSQYLPFINGNDGTDTTVFNWVYLYPGLAPQQGTPNGCGCDAPFYDTGSQGILQTGNFNVDGSIQYIDTSQFPGCPRYSVADQFNNSVRYPDELSKYQAVTAAAAAAGVAAPEISERMLLEGMLSSPTSFTNSIIVNLHGELVPLPPMRNYSDAAKDPANLNGAGGFNIRAVTHPELLYYPASGATTTVSLRVYSYYDGMDDPSVLPAAASTTISLFFPDLNLGTVSTPVTVIGICGSSSAGATYLPITLVANAAPVSGMAVSVIPNLGAGATQSMLVLKGSPLRCPSGPSTTGGGATDAGLAAADRLYGLEYIPCSPERTTLGSPFTARPLYYAGTGPKNTARWLISAGGVTVGQHTIETRLGDAVTQNLSPPNLSRTYVWVGNNFPPPETERYQYMGDPRHCPYLDVKVGGPGVAGAAATIQANGYNWYFKNMNGTVDGYTGFGAAGNVTGWGSNGLDVDLPRYFKTIRDGLVNTTSIWSTTNGYSFFYYGVGGEFGFDHPPYASSLTFMQGPWISTGTNTTLTTVSEIIANGATNQPRVIATTSNVGTAQQWYGKYWIGELYPDSHYSTWATIGNLPTRQNTDTFASGLKFFRSKQNTTAIATGGNSLSGFGRDYVKRPVNEGCVAFFNGTTAGGNWFQHTSTANTDTGNAYSLATTCYSIFQYPIPPQVSSNRPWALDGSGTPGNVSEWGIGPYNTNRTRLSIPAVSGLSRLFFDHINGSPLNATGVVRIADSPSVNKVGYVMMTGTSPSVNVGTAELAKSILIFSLRTFLDGGQMAATNTVGHIQQLPLIKISPSLGVTINPLAQYSNPATISFVVGGPTLNAAGTAPLPNVWYRYPGGTSNTANFYTEEYPGSSGPLTASNYAESVNLVYNLKYSNNGGRNWYFLQDNSAATKGTFDPTRAVTNSSPVTNIFYNWNVSNTATFPQGDYQIMAEVYRPNQPLHYSYHTIEITINR